MEPIDDLIMTAERMSGGSGIILKDRDSWYAWYGALKLRAYEMRVWHKIDPDEQSNDEEEEPEFPAFEKARARLLGRFLLENAKTAEPPTPESLSSGSSEPLAKPPFSVSPTDLQVECELERMRDSYVT